MLHECRTTHPLLVIWDLEWEMATFVFTFDMGKCQENVKSGQISISKIFCQKMSILSTFISEFHRWDSRGVIKKKRESVNSPYCTSWQETTYPPPRSWCTSWFCSSTTRSVPWIPPVLDGPQGACHQLWTSSSSSKCGPSRTPLIFVNSQKSHGARSGQYGECSRVVICLSARNCRMLRALCVQALSWCRIHLLCSLKSRPGRRIHAVRRLSTSFWKCLFTVCPCGTSSW